MFGEIVCARAAKTGRVDEEGQSSGPCGTATPIHKRLYVLYMVYMGMDMDMDMDMVSAWLRHQAASSARSAFAAGAGHSAAYRS